MPDVTRRMLSLLATLQTGRSFSGGELAARIGVSPRTLRRDVDRLREYGYPVETRPGPGGHYRLTAGAAMPPLMLEDDEAVAVLLGLAALAATGSAAEGSVDEAATRAYGKVEQYLPKRLRHRIARLRASLDTGDVPAPSTSAGYLGELADAIANRQVAAFEYRRADGAASARRVEPHRQLHHLQRWYLLAWDLDRGDWRVFRTDRIDGLRLSTSRFEPRAAPHAMDYLVTGIRRNREPVVFTVDAPQGPVADAFRHDTVELTALEDGRTRVAMHLESWEWPLATLAIVNAGFTIEAPERFLDGYRAFAARLRDAAG
ncbi:helix-turn-helix transcriptional regulator [Glycomyces terrestris]|uniref:WYL domain-containing protein n=1 Tax=Glycomyces terrestris TaxID=2493553 RepID=A0A426UV06_9ACTN|nr:WYL domain-containing protein [Glycomyces terrestris]RRR98152.1 WYL domain-containing protein [Glycomyces terrestris]